MLPFSEADMKASTIAIVAFWIDVLSGGSFKDVSAA